MHNNYFPELEKAAKELRKKFAWMKLAKLETADLEKALKDEYGIEIDRKALSLDPELRHVRSFFKKESSILFIKSGLSPAQENFLLGRELGFQLLKFKERPFETRILKIDSFEKLLNNFKASYFSAALLIDEQMILKDIRSVARENVWKPSLLTNLLDKYNVTPEMMTQRVTNIFPHHFDIEDIFFLRLSSSKDLSRIKMTKELHLSQLHNPYNNELNEHYCNKWVSVNVLKGLRVKKIPNSQGAIWADAQISKYYGTEREYFCFSIASPAFHNPEKTISVTLGFLIDQKLKGIVNFLNDPSIKSRTVNTTCERCPIVDCEARVAPPIQFEKEQQKNLIGARLGEL
ncbi:MAG: ImmA/IrrE family metallo-endopeptidase [Bacteroidota bacterium]